MRRGNCKSLRIERETLLGKSGSCKINNCYSKNSDAKKKTKLKISSEYNNFNVNENSFCFREFTSGF